MKKIIPLLGLIAISATPAIAQEKINPSSETEKYAYSQGYVIGMRVKQSLIKDQIDLKAFAQGVRDALTDKAQIPTAQIQESLQKGPVHLRAAKAKWKKDNEAFLAENKKKEGWKTTKTGLQYKILKSGPADGKNPKITDKVTVHYVGTLINGKKFDSSYDRKQPATFAVGQVVPGWTEILQMMKPGDKWSVVIPANLGYGETGAPRGGIAPNSTLLFDVELIGIK